MSTPPHHHRLRATLTLSLTLVGCAAISEHSLTLLQDTPLLINPLLGDIAPIRDPSIAFAGATYYLFSTDPAQPLPGQYLPIRCSPDQVPWTRCGQVFTTIPAWIATALPNVTGLWAPDISFSNGLYRLYYAASTPGSQSSAIGLATNITLNPTDPNYRWLDHGQVLASGPGDDFNAIDPNLLIDTDQRLWLTYGSYWSGIKQREIDPASGMLLASNPVRYDLATRQGVPENPIEGSSLVHHGSFYYLFLSVDYCCAARLADDNYKQIVGRSATPHGPFVDAQGWTLMQGGGSILLEGNSTWLAPGGGTAYLNPEHGDSLLVFHALQTSSNGTAALWSKSITWVNDWPVLI